jgi:hypothetical protein
MTIEYVLDIIERLDGAGLTIDNLSLLEEELIALGLCHEGDEECVEWDDEDEQDDLVEI